MLFSLGDVIREIDRIRLIEDDFVLVRSDVISNVNLTVGVMEHRKRRDESKFHCILTKFLRKLPLNSSDRSIRNELFTVLNTKDSEILKF